MTDNFVLDLTNYKDRVGQRVSPGRYRVIVEDAEMDKSKAGNQMINLWLRVVGGEFEGATIIDRLTISEKSLFRVVGFMQAIGLPTPKKRLSLNLAVFTGKLLDIDVEDGEPYNGRVKSEVRGYLRIQGAATKGVDAPDDLSGLDEFAPAPKGPSAFVEAAAEEVVPSVREHVEYLDELASGRKAEPTAQAAAQPAPAPAHAQPDPALARLSDDGVVDLDELDLG